MRVEVTAPAGRFGAVQGRTFADAGDEALVVYEASSGRLAIAVNLGSAADCWAPVATTS